MNRIALSPTVIAQGAANALREELETFPKPGLVSYVDHGSHPDMDAECFLASIAAIEPFLARMALAGEAGAALRDLQKIGLEAEKAMLTATGGRNTHKGAIFCLGLLCAAAGAQSGEPESSLGALVRRRWGGEIPQAIDLDTITPGIALCQIHGIGGVRREAALGFPSVYQHGLTSLRAIPDREAGRVHTFFNLLETCEDTTLLKRGGMAGLEYGRAEARRFLQVGGGTNPRWLSFAREIHGEFIRRNLTAGGAADLLAATLFVDAIDQIS